MERILYKVISFLLTGYMGMALYAAEKPNFIFILADDQGWSSTSLLMDQRISQSKSDYFETPSLETLAGRGMRFSSGYAPCALCCPTRRSIQFGQTPMRQGDDEQFIQKYYPSGGGHLTIPRMLKSIDPQYQTAHYGKWDLRSGIFPEDLGYDESDGNTGNRNGDMNSTKDSKWSDVYLNNDPKRMVSITERALNFMERNVREGHPFYLQISHYATHVDMQSTEETYQKYLKKTKGVVHSNPAWAAMLEDLDSMVGFILKKMEELGIANNTYIIYMADNGGVESIPPVKNKFDHPSEFPGPLRNFPLRAGKWTLYEGGIRVPFLVAGPGIIPGSQCDTPVSGWDLLPSIADLAGFSKPLPEDIDGKSFGDLLRKGNDGTLDRKNDIMVFHYFGKVHSAIRKGGYKLIRFRDLGRTELYDLENDPGELMDISKDKPEIADELDALLNSYIQEVKALDYNTKQN